MHIGKLYDSNSTKVRMGEMEVYTCKVLVLCIKRCDILKLTLIKSRR